MPQRLEVAFFSQRQLQVRPRVRPWVRRRPRSQEDGRSGLLCGLERRCVRGRAGDGQAWQESPAYTLWARLTLIARTVLRDTRAQATHLL